MSEQLFPDVGDASPARLTTERPARPTPAEVLEAERAKRANGRQPTPENEAVWQQLMSAGRVVVSTDALYQHITKRAKRESVDVQFERIGIERWARVDQSASFIKPKASPTTPLPPEEAEGWADVAKNSGPRKQANPVAVPTPESPAEPNTATAKEMEVQVPPDSRRPAPTLTPLPLIVLRSGGVTVEIHGPHFVMVEDGVLEIRPIGGAS